MCLVQSERGEGSGDQCHGPVDKVPLRTQRLAPNKDGGRRRVHRRVAPGQLSKRPWVPFHLVLTARVWVPRKSVQSSCQSRDASQRHTYHGPVWPQDTCGFYFINLIVSQLKFVRNIACDEGYKANIDGRTMQPPAHGQPAGRLVAQSSWFDYDVTNTSFQQPV